MVMNNIERIMATVKGENKDRLPISLTLSLYGAKLTGCPLKEYYTIPEKYVEGQFAVFEELEPDIIFGPFSLPIFGKSFGSELRIFEDQAPNLKKPVVKKESDIESLNFDKAFESKEINYFKMAVEGLVKQLGDRVLIAPISINPIDLPIMLMGIENWIDIVLSDPGRAEKLIQKTGKFFIDLVNEFFKMGAAFTIISSAFLNPRIVTKDLAIGFQAQLKEIFSQVSGPLIIHESGAQLIPFLEIFQNLPNVAGFVVNQKDDLNSARKLLTNNQILVGNIEGPELINKNPEQIRTEVKHIYKQFGKDRNFVMGSSGADIAYETPLENLKIIKETLEEISD